MSNDKFESKIATPAAVKRALKALKTVDSDGMLDCALEMPSQIIEAIGEGRKFDEGDIPLDRSRLHLVGIGGSAIAGELLLDMLAPSRKINVHRGTPPPHDRRGVIVSSYSGNTSEILEIAEKVVGGLRTVLVLTSGGYLERLADDWTLPIWQLPSGYQPRASVGWSLGYIASVMDRWNVTAGSTGKLLNAARRLKASLESIDLGKHLLIQAAQPIADAINNKSTVIFHSLSCTGAARRLAAQITENAKQAAFALAVPEALHNAVEGLAGVKPERWSFIFMTNQNDPPSLRSAMVRTSQHFQEMGFNCLPFPAAGDDAFELTLSRLLIADFVSLFLAGKRKIDPTPITTILSLKEQVEEPEEFETLEEEEEDTGEKTEQED